MRKLENSTVQLGTDILLCPLNLDVLFDSGESKGIYLYFGGGPVLFLSFMQCLSHLVCALSILSVQATEDKDNTFF